MHRYHQPFIAWIALAIAFVSLVFSFAAYSNTLIPQNVDFEDLQNQLLSGLTSLAEAHTFSSDEQFNQQLEELRSSLRLDYQQSSIQVRQSWERIDARLENIEQQADNNIDTAQASVGNWLIELGQNISE